MTKCFDHKDIDKWAFFSGDYNAVHFDADVAKKNGLNDIIAQGMLYLLYSKLSLKDEISAPARISYRLKKPIYKDALVNYSIENKHDEIFSKILSSDDKCSVTGRAYHDDKVPDSRHASHEIFVDTKFVVEQLELFKRSYPDIDVPWIIMDAFLFSVCFKFQNGDPFHRKALKITKEPDKSKVVTFQVDQDIYISEHEFPTEIEDMKLLRFFYEDTDVIKEDYSVYSVLNYQVFYKDLLLYQSTMGSVTRAYEAQANALKNGSENG